MENIKEEKEETHEMMMFSELSSSPIYPGCVDIEDKRTCFKDGISSFIRDNFNSSVVNGTDIKGTVSIMSTFVVDFKGDVTDIKIDAPHAVLEKETLRVLQALPSMVPGMFEGKPVNLIYSQPIVFIVE